MTIKDIAKRVGVSRVLINWNIIGKAVKQKSEFLKRLKSYPIGKKSGKRSVSYKIVIVKL
jgi:hypothetical protein